MTSSTRLLAPITFVAVALSACAPRGSSFETLGVPAVEDLRGGAAVIVGWARERRAGWSLRQVRIDGRARPEWDAETQRPVAIPVEPGRSTIQLYAQREVEGRPRRRLKIRPLSLSLGRDQVQLCVVALGGARRPRPRLRCAAFVGPEARSVAPAPSARPEPAQRADALAGGGPAVADADAMRAILERLERIEARLEELAAAGEGSPSAVEAGARPVGVTKLRIDTEFPWGEREPVAPRDRFERTFEESARGRRRR